MTTESSSTSTAASVLVVAQFFPPMQNARAIQAGRVVAALRAHGVDVRVVCGLYPREQESGEGGGVRHGQTGSKIYRSIAEIAAYANWPWLATRCVKAALANALDDGWRPDVVLSMSVPIDSHLIGRTVARRLGVAWAAFYSDPWPIWLAPGPYSGKRDSFKTRRQFTIAQDLIQGADAVLAPTREMLSLMASAFEGIAATPAVETLHCAPPPPEAMEVAVTRSIYHIGEVSAERSSPALIDAILQLSREEGRESETLTFVGGYADEFRAALSAAEASGFVRFAPSVSPERSRQMMSEAGALLLIEADMPGGPFLPSKLTDYAASGRPIVVVSNSGGAVQRIVSEQAGVRCVPHERSQIIAALRSALTPESGGTSLANAFSPAAVSDRYLDALSQAQANCQAR